MARRPLQSLEVIALILVNVGVFFHELSLVPMQRIAFDQRFGAVPVAMWEAWRTFRESGLSREVVAAGVPLVTASYLHAGVGHLAGNMLFLWIFANVVAQTIGRGLLLVVYAVGGIVAVLVYVRTNPTSDVPMIGASGAVAALEGAYFTLVFRWEVPHVFVWPLAGAVPASRLAFLAIWNFILDTGAFVGHSQTHVAYGAHVGGFLGGALVAMVIASISGPEWRG
jgi:membrane associated rhomboid family serine protease